MEYVLNTINEDSDSGYDLLNGSLLEDLKQLKLEVEVIIEKQKDERIVLEEIEEKQEQFYSLGQLSIHIYTITQHLYNINSIYTFNSQFFLNLFDSAIHRCVAVHSHRRSSDHSPTWISLFDGADDTGNNSASEISVEFCQVTLIQYTLENSAFFSRGRKTAVRSNFDSKLLEKWIDSERAMQEQ